MKKLLPVLMLSVLALTACSSADLPKEINIQLDPDSSETEEITVTVEDNVVRSNTSEVKTPTPAQNNPVEVSTRNPELSPNYNVIDFDNIYIGQQIGAMRVQTFSTPGSFSNQFQRWNSEIIFEGEIELTGEYEHMPKNDPFLGDRICITSLDSESMKKLPRPEDGFFKYIFCFDGYPEDVKAEFGSVPGESGTATFTIAQFDFIGLESAVWNGARLK